MRAWGWLVLWSLLAGTPAATAASLFDTGAVPYLTPSARRSYARFLGVNLPRAVAISPDGRLGWDGGTFDTQARADAKALANCRQAGGTRCALYGVGLDVVWPGMQSRPPPPPGPILSTWDYSFVPDARYVWRGPQSAAGVFVWSNGKAGDMDFRGVEPAPWVRAFNLAGYDVVRFDRDPTDDQDTDRAARWLRRGLRAVRAMGYRSVVAGGQSRGAWNSLQMLDARGLADAVIAVSPAAQGTAGGGNLFAQDDDLRRILADAPASATRLAVVQFQGDLFMADAGQRKRMVEAMRDRLGGLLFLDRPAGFSGHFAAQSFEFEERYGACLVRFVTAPAAGPGAPDGCYQPSVPGAPLNGPTSPAVIQPP